MADYLLKIIYPFTEFVHSGKQRIFQLYKTLGHCEMVQSSARLSARHGTRTILQLLRQEVIVIDSCPPTDMRCTKISRSVVP